MYQCKQCLLEFDSFRKLGGHITGMIKMGLHVKENKEVKKETNYSNISEKNGNCVCPICFKEYSKKGIKLHIWRKHGEGIKHDPNSGYKNGRQVWNKGKTSDTNNSLKKAGETYKLRLKNGEIIHPFKNKKHNSEFKKKLSDKINEKIQNGEWHLSFSKSRTIEYNGIKFLGSWEVNYAKWLDQNNIKWRRPTERFEYVLEGKKRRYTPDFYLIDEGVYVEIKGYPTKKDFAKWDYFPLNLKILSGPMLKEMGIIEDCKIRNIEYKGIKWY